MKKVEQISAAENHAAATVGAFNQLGEHVFTLAPGFDIPGKVFVGKELQNTGTEVSFTVTPAGMGGDFLHTHKTNEEIYVVLSGTGKFQVDGHIFPISEGSVIRVSPAGKRAYRNTGDSDLTMICIQSQSNTLTDLGISDGVILEEPINW